MFPKMFVKKHLLSLHRGGKSSFGLLEAENEEKLKTIVYFLTRSKPQVVSDKGSSSSHILSPKPKSRTSLTNEDVLRDLQTKEEEKISHVDSGKGSKSPLSTEVSNTSPSSTTTWPLTGVIGSFNQGAASAADHAPAAMGPAR